MPDPSVATLTAIAEAAARAGAMGLREHGAAAERKSGQNDVVTADDRAAEARIVEMLRAAALPSLILGEEGGPQGDRTSPQGVHWHVDPIDGTSNYAAGLPAYCVSVGATIGGRPVAGVVYDPRRDELFATAAEGVTVNGVLLSPASADAADAPEVEADGILLSNLPYEGAWFRGEDVEAFIGMLHAFRGVRRLGSAALALAYVAAGRASAALEFRTNPWDHVAGAALVLASGGAFRAVDADGAPTDDAESAVRYAATAHGFAWGGSALSRLIAPTSTTDERRIAP